MFEQIMFGQVSGFEADTAFEPSIDVFDVENDVDYFNQYEYIENAKLSNKKKVFKSIYTAAKKRKLLNNQTVQVSVFIDSTGELLSVEFYGEDSIYTFMRKIFLKKAKYTKPCGYEGAAIQQVFGEKVILSKEFLLGDYEYGGNDFFSSMSYKTIKSFDQQHYVRLKLSEVFYNGAWHKSEIDRREKVIRQSSPIIKLSDSVAVYFEFPQVVFKEEKYFLCRYYIKEKKDGLWNNRCQDEMIVRYCNLSFVNGITCGISNDPLRLEIKLDLSIEIDE